MGRSLIGRPLIGQDFERAGACDWMGPWGGHSCEAETFD